MNLFSYGAEKWQSWVSNPERLPLVLPKHSGHSSIPTHHWDHCDTFMCHEDRGHGGCLALLFPPNLEPISALLLPQLPLLLQLTLE